MRRLLLLILRLTALALTLVCADAMGEDALVVVMRADSDSAMLTRNEVINIFLGRYRKLPSGSTVTPVDTLPHKEQFYANLVNKTLAEIGAYWARLKFSGQTIEPRQATLAEAIALVAKTPGAIGYVPMSEVDTRLKILYRVER